PSVPRTPKKAWRPSSRSASRRSGTASNVSPRQTCGRHQQYDGRHNAIGTPSELGRYGHRVMAQDARKVIAVTGANRGIRAAIGLELRRRGHVVGCLARSGKGPDTAGEADAIGRFIEIVCDVTSESSVRDALARLADTAGALNGLVNNAGI